MMLQILFRHIEGYSFLLSTIKARNKKHKKQIYKTWRRKEEIGLRNNAQRRLEIENNDGREKRVKKAEEVKQEEEEIFISRISPYLPYTQTTNEYFLITSLLSESFEIINPKFPVNDLHFFVNLMRKRFYAHIPLDYVQWRVFEMFHESQVSRCFMRCIKISIISNSSSLIEIE